MMKVLFVTSEIQPWIKTGGLADVSSALPQALHRAGIDIQVLVPGYPEVMEIIGETVSALQLTGSRTAFGEMRILSGVMLGNVPVHVLEAPHLYERPGGPYQDELGQDWDDNALRFGALGRAAALLASAPLLDGWQPDVVHCNDWQAGLAPAYLAFSRRRHAATVVSIHNLAFQGLFEPALLKSLQLPDSSFSVEGLEFHGQISYMKAGLHYADHITTVSPTYAEEIQTEAFGCGLDALLHHRRDSLSGILNGIDTLVWDPATDPLIENNYSADALDGKAGNRRALQRAFGLPERDDAPLLGMVSRLTHQKGIPLVTGSAELIRASGTQLVVLGTGQARYEKQLQQLAAELPDQVSVKISYDEPLAHLLEAGADMFLMPSLYEPCGLNQMYSMRYGTVPIVRRTGGLADTVIPVTPESLAAGTATGFAFDEPEAEALQACIGQAMATWTDKDAWAGMQKNGMARDFSWDASAPAYIEAYEKALRHRRKT